MRRCGWCGVELRWWQIFGCRVCAEDLRLNKPSPRYSQKSRWGTKPDKFPIQIDRGY